MHADMVKYLEWLCRINHTPVTFAGNTPADLNRWLVKCEYKIPDHPLSPEPLLSLEGKILTSGDLDTMSKEEIDVNWRYYISTNPDDFYTANHIEPVFSSRRDKTIYCLNSIYCEKDEYVVFNINNMMPISIWIDGQLAVKNHLLYLVRPDRLFIRLSRGLHFVLVERVALRKNATMLQYNHYFYIAVKPFAFLTRGFRFIDKQELDHQQKGLVIIPDRTVYEQTNTVQVLVLSNRVIPDLKFKIKLVLSDFKGKPVFTINAFTHEIVVLDPLPPGAGVYRITAVNPRYGLKGSTYIFKGDMEEKTALLIREAETRKDCHAEILYNLRCLNTVLDFKTGFFKGTYEIAFKDMYDFILGKYAAFEQYLSSADTTAETTLPAIYKSEFMYFRKSMIDDDYTAGRVQLPAGYWPGKRVALAINVNYGNAGNRYPLVTAYSQIGLFKNTVILNICGRGGFNRDFINELEITGIINRCLRDFNIDRDRIILMGHCAGGLKIYSMAFHYPGIFSALASIHGTVRMELSRPDYSYSKNIDNMTVYSVTNIDDYSLNAARVIDTAGKFKRLKQFCYSRFLHLEFERCFHSRKLLQSVIKEKRNPYPAVVEFLTSEPHCNRSYWVKIGRIKDLNAKARIKARIINPARISLEMDNIEVLNLLINRKQMKLNRKIFLISGEIEKQVTLHDYCLIKLIPGGNEIDTTVTPVAEKDFQDSYNSLQMDCPLLGIKEVYTGKCLIIKPDYYNNDTDTVFTEKIFHSLHSPLQEKNRHYNYPVIPESALAGKLPHDSNFVYCFDAGKPGADFLKEFDFEFTPRALKIDNREFTGESFLFYKTGHPHNGEKLGLLVAYNCPGVKNELLKFMDSFDTNPLFYNDLVVYNQGSYRGFRN